MIYFCYENELCCTSLRMYYNLENQLSARYFLTSFMTGRGPVKRQSRASIKHALITRAPYGAAMFIFDPLCLQRRCKKKVLFFTICMAKRRYLPQKHQKKYQQLS